MNKNLLSFLRFLAILCVLLVLLLFIANATYRNSFKNEIKYKENFNTTPLTSADPVPVGLDKNMVEGTYKEADKQLYFANQIEYDTIKKLNHAKEQQQHMEARHKQAVDTINDTKNKVKEYSGNVAKLNQTLYNMRNGNPNASEDIDKVGTFDATLYL
tara:strand:- start:111 stop:584 length:474 start_codon:yes stop_codon:yes gene_type:complete